MLLGAQLTEGAQALLQAEAESTATQLSNMIWKAGTRHHKCFIS